MNLILGLFKIPKNIMVIYHNSSHVGAKRNALRPRAGVSCNSIYRTYKGSSYD